MVEEDKHDEEKISYTGSRKIYPANPAHQSQKKNLKKQNKLRIISDKRTSFLCLMPYFLSRIKGNIYGSDSVTSLHFAFIELKN